MAQAASARSDLPTGSTAVPHARPVTVRSRSCHRDCIYRASSGGPLGCSTAVAQTRARARRQEVQGRGRKVATVDNSRFVVQPTRTESRSFAPARHRGAGPSCSLLAGCGGAGEPLWWSSRRSSPARGSRPRAVRRRASPPSGHKRMAARLAAPAPEEWRCAERRRRAEGLRNFLASTPGPARAAYDAEARAAVRRLHRRSYETPGLRDVISATAETEPVWLPQLERRERRGGAGLCRPGRGIRAARKP